MASGRIDQMKATIDALSGPLTEVTTEVKALRTAANASAAAIANLTATSDRAWDGHASRMDQLESDVTAPPHDCVHVEPRAAAARDAAGR